VAEEAAEVVDATPEEEAAEVTSKVNSEYFHLDDMLSAQASINLLGGRDGGGGGGGTCYAFQKGECTRGSGCRFSHEGGGGGGGNTT
jgi:hypothetical protein